MASFSFEHTHGPSISQCTETSAVIWYRDDQGVDTPPQITYWPAATITHTKLSYDSGRKSSTSVTVQVDPHADFTSTTTLSNLTPNTVYKFEVGNQQGSFKTPGSAACSFVFGSCVGGQGYGRNAPGHEDGEGFPIFEKMMNLQPDFFVHNGDSIYADDTIQAESDNPWNEGARFITQNGVSVMPVCSDLESMRDRYKYHLEDPALSNFLSRCPVYASWDDHEVMDNFGQELMQHSGLGKLCDDGRRAFLDYWPIEKAEEEPTRMYRSFTWGPHVEMFILDSRSYRDVHELRGDDKTPTMEFILGEAQLKWLLQGLSSSKSTWKFVASSIPLSYPTGWPTPEVDGYDGWSDGKWDNVGGPEKELLKIFEHIRDHDIQNVIFLSGDVHYPYAISYDPFKSGKPLIYELAATPFHALCLPPPPEGPDNTFNPTVLFSDGTFGGKLFNFGEVSIDDDGDFAFHIRDRKGSSIFDLQLRPAISVKGEQQAGRGNAFVTQTSDVLPLRQTKESTVFTAH